MLSAPEETFIAAQSRIPVCGTEKDPRFEGNRLAAVHSPVASLQISPREMIERLRLSLFSGPGTWTLGENVLKRPRFYDILFSEKGTA